MPPHDFPRRILLAVTGLTPQVTTESLYALCVEQHPPFIPTEIHLVTTAEGADRARLSLLDPATGKFHAFCRDYSLVGRIAFPEENIHVITDAEGQPLSDIRTPADNTLAADCLLGYVRRFCSDDMAAVHVSIAGGRKTMGFFIGYALSFFGRVQDRLSHVLVSAPFESLTEFFYPPRAPQVLHTREGKPVHTGDARIMLAEIPFVRLRDGLPKDALLHSAPFASLVAAAQTGVSGSSLRFDLQQRAAWCGAIPVRLPPALLAWYGWLALLRATGRGEDGFVRFSDVEPDEFLTIYARIVGPYHASLEAARRSLRAGFDAPFFEQKTSKFNRILQQALSLAAEPYLIRVAGKRPLTRYGLGLPGACIQPPKID